VSQSVSQFPTEKQSKSVGGRPKGLGKVPGSGRVKGQPTRLGKEARAYLAEHGGALENIVKIAKGKRVRIAGPTGKALWHTPTPAEVVEANYWIAARLVPSMSSQEITGADGGPVGGPAAFLSLLQSIDNPGPTPPAPRESQATRGGGGPVLSTPKIPPEKNPVNGDGR